VISRFFSYSSIFGYALILGILSCGDKKPKEQHPAKDYIKKIDGFNDSIPQEIVQRGEVLIAYSDCYSCHAKDKRSKGPAFEDIAARYPVNKAYIRLLAARVIQGGSGAWGHPVMTPHPDLSPKEAELMVSYILSLKKGSKLDKF